MGATFSGLPKPVLLGLVAASVAGIAALLVRPKPAVKDERAEAKIDRPAPSAAKEKPIAPASAAAKEPPSAIEMLAAQAAAMAKEMPTQQTPGSNAKSAPTYNSATMLQVGKVGDKTKTTEGNNLGYRSQQCDKDGELVAPVATSGSRPTVYCDLDGTLCDFELAVSQLFKSPFQSIQKKQMWTGLQRARDFYAKLPWLSEGRKLWEGIQVLSPAILTGVPKVWGGAASKQKRQWAKRELGENVPILTSFKEDKWRACRSGDILIDDEENHRRRWEEQGGIFLHHSGDASATLALLQQLLILPPPPQTVATGWVQAKWSGDFWWCKVLSQEGGLTEVEFMEPPFSGEKHKMPPKELRWPQPPRN